MKLWVITYGVGAGYNDADRQEVIPSDTKQGAMSEAYQAAVEVFEEYDEYDESGFDIDEDTDEETRQDIMEGWIEYSVVPYDENNEEHKKLCNKAKLTKNI